VLADWHDPDPPEVDAAVIEPGDPQGIPFARLLRVRGLPVVFTSIFPAEQDALDLEPAAYFVKPFALNELETVLSSALAAQERQLA
jgi:hypothetical protein